MTSRHWLQLTLVILLGTGGFLAWRYFQPPGLPTGFAASNGRIEAVEVDIASKAPGRIAEILVNEGDFISTGQVVAQMDTDVLHAQLREAEAELRRAKSFVETTRSRVRQRESEKESAVSIIAQRKAELEVARRTLARTQSLRPSNATTEQELDQDKAKFYSAEAALSSANANVAAADAAIATSKSEQIGAEAQVEAAEATIQRLQVDINDSSLKVPRDGRVQFRIAQPGEVLNAGGKVLNMVDLADVYMTFFLPTEQAGRIAIGAETRLVLDAAPNLVIPARVTFVENVAQFTPKTVETAEERQKLMFRIKAHIDPVLLKKHIEYVKTGLPGMAYVRIDPQAEWPDYLQVRPLQP